MTTEPADIKIEDGAEDEFFDEDSSPEDGEDEEYDEFDEMSCPERVLDVCVRSIVDELDAVDIDIDETEQRMALHVRVAPSDMGKIIGKRGRVANALRTLIKAAGALDGIHATVEIDD